MWWQAKLSLCACIKSIHRVQPIIDWQQACQYAIKPSLIKAGRGKKEQATDCVVTVSRLHRCC